MKRKALFLVIGVFILGILVGGVATYVGERRFFGWWMGRGGTNEVVQQLTKELQLNADQQQKLESVLDETRARYDSLYKSIQPDREKIRQEGRDQIRALLTPEQRSKFEEFVRRIDERQKRNRPKKGR